MHGPIIYGLTWALACTARCWLQCLEQRHHHLTYLTRFILAAILRTAWKKARVEGGQPVRELMGIQNRVAAVEAVRRY